MGRISESALHRNLPHTDRRRVAALRTALPHGEQKDGRIHATLAGTGPAGRHWQGVQQGILQGRESGREEGIQLGEERGRQEGIQLGAERTQRRILAKLLVSRFGPLDTATEQRLQQASLEQMDRWTDQALTAQRLDEVFRLQ